MARNFDGVDDFLEISDNAAIDVNNADFTAAIWTRTSSTPGANDALLCKGNSSGAPANGVRYEMLFEGSTKLDFVVDDNINKSTAVFIFSGEFTDNIWHLWLFERDAGVTLKIFLDGSTQKASATDNTGDIDNPLSLLIGARRDAGTVVRDFWPGQIAEFSLWKRKLSAGEKNMVFAMGPYNLQNNLNAYFPIWGADSPEPQYAGLGPGSATVNGTTTVDHVPIGPQFGFSIPYHFEDEPAPPPPAPAVGEGRIHVIGII